MKKLNCSHAEEWIIARLDEGLDREKAELLEAHLQACENCRRIERETSLLLTSVATDLPCDPGDEFWKKYDATLEARLREIDLKAKPAFPWKHLAFALAAGVFLVVIGLETLRQPLSEPAGVSREVVRELDLLYGPVSSEESVNSSGVYNQLLATVSATPAEGDAPVPWFEVEDEQSQWFL